MRYSKKKKPREVDPTQAVPEISNPKQKFKSRPVSPTIGEWSAASQDYIEAPTSSPLPTEPSIPLPPNISRLATLRDRIELTELLAEQARRRRESLRLYRPYPDQDEFHKSKATYRLARGGNRGGKTLSVAVELSRAVTRTDPYKKFPQQGRAIIVSKDLLDCSKVMFRKLFKHGGSGMKILRDGNIWRTYDPRTDQAREAEAEDAPALIPLRFYDPRRISWENKREEVPRTVRLKTGWEITFFSGNAEPPQGWDVDLVVFDEEIPHPGWFSEMVPRIVDRHGKLIWSATAQVGTVALYDLSQRAEKAVHERDPNPRVTEHIMTVFTNPYISEVDRVNFLADLEAAGEDELRVRGHGDFAIHGRRVYPEFAPRGVHHIDSFPIPEDWTRYIAIDPGRQVAASLFAAVPPRGGEYEGRGIIYAEAYIRKCNALLFAQTIKQIVGNSWIHGWIIDHQEGRRVETASGRSVEEQYQEEMIKVGLKNNGFTGFAWATSDVDAGILAARNKLQLREGKPEWLFMTDNLRWLCWEAERYTYRTLQGFGMVTDRILGSQDHLMDCMRYLALSNLRYVKPPKRGPGTYAKGLVKYIQDKKRNKTKKEGWGGAIRL